MELTINNINPVIYQQVRKTFKKFIYDECGYNLGTTVVLHADEISISYSKDDLAEDLVNIRLYTRSLSKGVQGFSCFFQLGVKDFSTILMM